MTVEIEVSICMLVLCVLLDTSTFFYQIKILFLINSISICTILYCINIFLFNSCTTFQSIKSLSILDKSLDATFKFDYIPNWDFSIFKIFFPTIFLSYNKSFWKIWRGQISYLDFSKWLVYSFFRQLKYRKKSKRIILNC